MKKYIQTDRSIISMLIAYLLVNITTVVALFLHPEHEVFLTFTCTAFNLLAMMFLFCFPETFIYSGEED